MKRLIVGLFLCVAAMAQQQTLARVNAGALSCGARKLAPSAAGTNVQVYCYSALVVVFNSVYVIHPTSLTIAEFSSVSDLILWNFSMSGANVSFTVFTGKIDVAIAQEFRALRLEDGPVAWEMCHVCLPPDPKAGSILKSYLAVVKGELI